MRRRSPTSKVAAAINVVAVINPTGAATATHLISFDADEDWVSQLQHAVQDLHGNSNRQMR